MLNLPFRRAISRIAKTTIHVNPASFDPSLKFPEFFENSFDASSPPTRVAVSSIVNAVRAEVTP